MGFMQVIPGGDLCRNFRLLFILRSMSVMRLMIWLFGWTTFARLLCQASYLITVRYRPSANFWGGLKKGYETLYYKDTQKNC